jgi:glycosyltransferase involved in cell wall biosynthesis
MTTILQITPAYKPAYIYGGPTRSISKLCEELVNTAFRILVLTTTANGEQELPVPTAKTILVDCVEVQYFRRLSKDHSHFSPGLLWQLVRLSRTAQQQHSASLIIHIHSWWNLIAIATVLIAKWYRLPVVLSARGMLTAYTFTNRHRLIKRIIHETLGKRLLGNLAIHATTKKEATDIRNLCIPYRQIYTIPNLVNFPLTVNTTSTRKNTDDGLQLLFLSRIDKKKGLPQLFAALQTLTLPWKLKIAGSGDPHYIAALKKLTQALNIQHQIKWMGSVADGQKFDLLRSSDFLILPSFNENFANVVVESLAVGTPVIISTEVGLADYVITHNMGWVCDTDPLSLANNIRLAAQDLQKRNFIRQKGPGIIRRDYAAKTILLDYVNMYQQILQHGR